VFNLVTASGWQSLADAPVASINEGGVLNAASNELGAAVAPGSIAAVYGSFPLSSFPPKDGLPLPPMLAGLAFKFGAGFPAPLFAVSSAQVNLQVPWELAPQTDLPLIVT
jgi:uncharacterized protein (TIGR03437 family)